jgi:hypothetical protein
MSIFTQTTSPAFTKQSIDEFFVAPFFKGEDLRSMMTVRTDIKGTEKLNKISRPSKITKPKTTAGFTAGGSFALTYQNITVQPMAIEFEQNGREFWESILEQLLAKGYKEDDVEQMSNPDIWNSIMLPIIAEAGEKDVIRQSWFCDTLHEEQTSSVPNATVDEDFEGYTGLHSHLLADSRSATIPNDRSIDSSTNGAKQASTETLTATTGGTITLTINGTAYSAVWDTSITITVNNWFAAHGATIMARGSVSQRITVANTGAGVLTFVANFKGQPYTVVQTSAGTGGGATWTTSAVTANAAEDALPADKADAVFEDMIDAMENELLDHDPVFITTRAMSRNYIATLKGTGTSEADYVLLNGKKVLTYEGIPIIVVPEWDATISADFAGVCPNRTVLTTTKNLIFGTDGISDEKDVETWYNQDLQMRRYRVQYKAQTAYLHQELIVLSGYRN